MENGNNKLLKAPAGIKRRFCVFLAVLLAAGMLTAIPAGAMPSSDAEAQSRIAAVKEVLNAVGYHEYIKASTDIYVEEHGVMPMGSGEIVIKPGDYVAAHSTAAGVTTGEQQGKNAIYLPEDGSVSFRFNVAKEGLYNLSFEYLQVVGKTSAIERMIKIGQFDANTGLLKSRVPSKEAR